MKVEITEKGVFANGEPVEVGTTIDVKGNEIPSFLVNKCRVVSQPKPAKAKAVTNPAKGSAKDLTPAPSAQERQGAMKEAALKLDADGFNDDGAPDVRALNEAKGDGVDDFTAAERDQLWPGISDAVKAERGE